MIFDESIRIARPPAEVFAYLTDIQDWAVGPGSPVISMEKQPDGPTRVGTRWREVIRWGPLSLTMRSEVTALEPDRLLALRFRGSGMRGRLLYTLEPINSGTTVLRHQEWMRTVGCLRPFDRWLGRMLRSRLTERLIELRDDIESRDGQPGPTRA